MPSSFDYTKIDEIGLGWIYDKTFLFEVFVSFVPNRSARARFFSSPAPATTFSSSTSDFPLLSRPNRAARWFFLTSTTSFDSIPNRSALK